MPEHWAYTGSWNGPGLAPVRELVSRSMLSFTVVARCPTLVSRLAFIARLPRGLARQSRSGGRE